MECCSMVVGHKEPGMTYGPVYTKGGVTGRQNIYEVWREPSNQIDNGSYGKVHLRMT